jgi:predicted transposase/invertase (TIGR01784 family)
MQNNEPIHNNFFMKTFQDLSNTRDFIKGTLPEKITKNLDLSTVKIVSGTHVDENLKSHMSDLVVKVKSRKKDNVDLYFLFEHKSHKDKNILWQLLKYQFLMLEEDHNAKRDFRIIVPIVFYHGKGKWNISKKFSDFNKVPDDFKPYVLSFEYLLFDTRDFDLSQDEEFTRNAYLMSAISLMKEMKNMDSEKLATLLKYLSGSGLIKDKVVVLTLFEYFAKSNDVGKKEVVDIIRKELGDEAEEIMPSLAQRWIEEGEEKGFKKGIVKEKIDVCKNALNSGISPEVVSKITGLSLKKVLEIKKELQ